MQPAIEVSARPDQHIGGRAEAPDRLISSAAVTKPLGGAVVHDYHRIIVAVRSRVSTRRGAKQVDPLRMVDLDQANDNLRQERVASRWSRNRLGL